ncbi:hypothetical protein LINPERHAP2_LOCUS14962 [Linum perenne]
MDNNIIVDMTNMTSHDENIHSSSDVDDEDSREDSDFEPPTEDVPTEEVNFDEVNTNKVFPRAVTNSPLSSYRNSSESEHDVDTKFDDENSTSVFAG